MKPNLRVLPVLVLSVFCRRADGDPLAGAFPRVQDEQFTVTFAPEGPPHHNKYILTDGNGFFTDTYFRSINQETGKCTTLFFMNNSNDNLTIVNPLSPDGVALRPDTPLAPGANVALVFCCDGDEGVWKFYFKGPNAWAAHLNVDVTCRRRAKLRINEFDYDPPQNPKEPFQYLELCNSGYATGYLDGMVISVEGNNGTDEAMFKFPGSPGGTSIPLNPGQHLLLVVDATGSSLPGIDYEFYGGPSDSDDPSVPNLVKVAGTAPDLILSNTGDGLTLSLGFTTAGPIPCSEVVDGVSWGGGGVGETTAVDSLVCSDRGSHPGYANGGPGGTNSLQRCSDGFDTNNTRDDFTLAERTPGATNDCSTVATDVSDHEVEVAPAFDLSQNRPNPFNPVTTIEFAVPMAARAVLTIHDARGQLVRILLQRDYSGPSRDRVTWDGRDSEGKAVSSGLYFCKLEAGSYNATRKMLLVR